MNMGWGSMFDLLLFLLYAWCARFVGPTVAICSFYFLAMRCRYSSILILSWREEHHQVHHCAKIRSANPVLDGEER